MQNKEGRSPYLTCTPDVHSYNTSKKEQEEPALD